VTENLVYRGGEYKGYCLLRCDGMYSGINYEITVLAFFNFLGYL
jgi:hypothetical protein